MALHRRTLALLAANLVLPSAAMAQPEILKKLESVGAESIGSMPQALAEHLDKELVRWGALIKERDIRLD